MNNQTYTWKYLTEAPYVEGPHFQGEVKSSDITPRDYKNFYLGGKVPAEDQQKEIVAEVIVKLKEFLLTQPNKIFPGETDDFRLKIAQIIKQVEPSVSLTDAKYGARLIEKYLKINDIIVYREGGIKVIHPIVTKEIVAAVAQKLEPVLSGEVEPEEEGHTGTLSDDEFNKQFELRAQGRSSDITEYTKPPFDVNVRYEKYSDNFDESKLSEEESDALDTINDDDTGSKIVSRLQTKRSFREKTVEQIHSLINALIKKGALTPTKGYKFDVSEDGKRSANLGESSSIKKSDDVLMLEAYLKRDQRVIKEAGGLIDKAVSKFGWGNAAAQARGNVQAANTQKNLYQAFLRSLGQSGYNAKNVPGNFVVNWLNQNLSPSVSGLPEARQINTAQPIADTQKTFNQILQSYNRSQVVGTQPQPSVVPNTQPQPQSQPLAPQPVAQVPITTKQPKAQLPPGITPQDIQQLLAKIMAAPDSRARTRAMNRFFTAKGGANSTPPPSP